MKNIFKKIIILLILCFSLFVFGCNSESKSDASYDNSSPEIGTESKGDGSEVVIDTNRKVIYKVTLNITTQNVSNGVKKYNQKIVDLKEKIVQMEKEVLESSDKAKALKEELLAHYSKGNFEENLSFCHAQNFACFVLSFGDRFYTTTENFRKIASVVK